jgi:tricorn protease-like protein
MNSISLDKYYLKDAENVNKSVVFTKRGYSTTVFNNNKFSLVLKIDNEKKERKDLLEFKRNLKPKIITSDDFEKTLFSKSSFILIFSFDIRSQCRLYLQFGKVAGGDEKTENINFCE